eukprot:4698618-Amphidinium_carterae.1
MSDSWESVAEQPCAHIALANHVPVEVDKPVVSLQRASAREALAHQHQVAIAGVRTQGITDKRILLGKQLMDDCAHRGLQGFWEMPLGRDEPLSKLAARVLVSLWARLPHAGAAREHWQEVQGSKGWSQQ